MKEESKEETRILRYAVQEIGSERERVFLSQGIGQGVAVPPLVMNLYHNAEELFYQLARPIGMIKDITLAGFSPIFQGEGSNDPDTPLEHIYPRASSLALFAFTLGAEISWEISRLLAGGDLALGYMLDSIASFCTYKAARISEENYLNMLLEQGQANESTRVLNYSPGYCGWHITGQRKLFEVLKPGEIGITLNESCLMIPLKSVSGVMVAGNKEIHYFKNNYPFCEDCTHHSCRRRIQSIK